MGAILDLLLGVVTSIGGFVEAGSISTAAQAGAEFGFQLLWAIATATLMLALLTEMSGRLAAVGRRSLAAAVRERFGIQFQIVPLAAESAIDLLLLAAEIGGVGIALRLLTGTGAIWWMVPVGLVAWGVLWLCRFAAIEYGLGLLGLVTLSFVVSAWRLQPPLADVSRALLPSVPAHGLARYGFLAVSILGATLSPYLLNFYASGTVEERMTERELWVNRTTAYAGMWFGGMVSMAVLVTSAVVFHPSGVHVDSFDQAARMLVPAFGAWGIPVFALSLGIGCFGAAVELALNSAYTLAQVFGWPWGANRPRTAAARFSAAFTLVLVAAVALASTGIDPMQLTLACVALTVVIVPAVVLPFLVLMNDPAYVKGHTSGAVGNAVLAVMTVLAALLALVVIPLQITGGG